MNIKQLLWMFLLLIPPTVLWAEDPPVIVGNFSQGDITGWEEKEFQGSTSYQLVQIDSRTVVKAESRQSASGFFKQVSVDLTQTPFLNWSWKVENILQVTDERRKEGDDYPARVYIVVKNSFLFWDMNAINYVWSSLNPVGETWPNAYTSKACVFVVAAGNERIKQWVSIKRNINQDFEQCFGRSIRKIDAVAIMSDTDDAGGSAIAYFGDIFFSTE